MMKILFPILLFSIHLSFARESYIAVITDPQVGPQSNSANLIEVVDDINKIQNISFVVVLGNITANGNLDEFTWAEEILDGLTTPYFVVGGEKDYSLSEGNGSEISLLWGDDKYFFSNRDFSLACFNTFVPGFPKKKYIDAETMIWLDEKISTAKSSRFFLFSCNPVALTENRYQFFEMILDKKIFSFAGKEDKAAKDNSVFEGLYLNRKDGWGYILVSVEKDSIYIKKILSDEIKKKVKPEIVGSAFKSPLLLESDKTAGYISPGSKLWSVNINKIKSMPSSYEGNKIFSVFDNGLVNCLSSSGLEEWRFDTNEKLCSPPLIEDNLLVTASDDGDIFTFNANTGHPIQVIGTGERISSGISLIDIGDRGYKTKAIILGTIYGKIFCYDLYTLENIWTETLTAASPEARITSSIIYSDKKIFFRDSEGTLSCLSASNGMLIWKIEASKGGWKTGAKSSGLRKVGDLVAVNNNLFLTDEAGNLFCVDALLGTIKWSIKYINTNGLIGLNDKRELILPTTKNKIIVVSPVSRKVISEIELPSTVKDEAITALLLIGDKIFAGFSDGWVYKINKQKKAEKFFRTSAAPIISLTNVDGKYLVTDYDGRLTLLNVLP
jgi:outer membrane protein assembly factor BamB